MEKVFLPSIHSVVMYIYKISQEKKTKEFIYVYEIRLATHYNQILNSYERTICTKFE